MGFSAPPRAFPRMVVYGVAVRRASAQGKHLRPNSIRPDPAAETNLDEFTPADKRVPDRQQGVIQSDFR